MENFKIIPQKIYIALLGFGSANQALAQLLIKNKNRLADNPSHPVEIVVTGIFTRSHGGIICPAGLDLSSALENASDLSQTRTRHPARAENSTQQRTYDNTTKAGTDDILRHMEILKASQKIDTLVEGIIANYIDAEPAISFARWALGNGIHYCTANKAPVALFYDELTALGRSTPHIRLTQNGNPLQTKFRFESACGDGVPLFSLARHSLLGCRVVEFEGINNTTTNLILQKMEDENLTIEAGIELAQKLGIAEADPSGDIEGHDAAVKCLCLAKAMMQTYTREDSDNTSSGNAFHQTTDMPVSIEAIPKVSLNEATSLEEIQALRAEGKRIKIICSGKIVINAETQTEQVICSVSKQIIDKDHPFYNVNGCDNVWRFSFDNLCPITIIQHDGETRDTGYGLFSDLLDCINYRELD